VILILTIIGALLAAAAGLVIAGPPGGAVFAVVAVGLIQLIARLLKKPKK